MSSMGAIDPWGEWRNTVASVNSFPVNDVPARRVIADVLRTWAFEWLARTSSKAAARSGHQKRIFVDVHDHIGARVATRGFYDGYRLEALASLIKAHPGTPGKRKSVALDVGGNIGNHALFMSDLFDSVLSFEPIPALADVSRATAAMNGATNVTIFNCGLSDRNGPAKIFLNTHNYGASSLSGGLQAQSALGVDLRRGDDLLIEHVRENEVVDFVKIDVEGHEAPALRGLMGILTKHRPAIWFEAHTACLTKEIMSTLAPAGYDRLYLFGDPLETRSGFWRNAVGRACSGMRISLHELSEPPAVGGYLNFIATARQWPVA